MSGGESGAASHKKGADQPNADNVAKGVIDYTHIPALLDSRFEALDEDGALHPTILTAGKGERISASGFRRI